MWLSEPQALLLYGFRCPVLLTTYNRHNRRSVDSDLTVLAQIWQWTRRNIWFWILCTCLESPRNAIQYCFNIEDGDSLKNKYNTSYRCRVTVRLTPWVNAIGTAVPFFCVHPCRASPLLHFLIRTCLLTCMIEEEENEEEKDLNLGADPCCLDSK